MKEICEKLKSENENVDFLNGNELSYCYYKKRLNSLILFFDTKFNHQRWNSNYYTVSKHLVERSARICRLKEINCFIVLYSFRENKMIRINLLNKDGNHMCQHKYVGDDCILDLTDAKNVSTKPFGI